MTEQRSPESEAPREPAEAPAASPATSDTPPPPSEKRRAGGRDLPAWLPLVLVALIPALVVAGLVYLLAGGGNGNGGAAGVIDGFVRSGGPNQEAIESYKGSAPPGFPDTFPRYRGADIVVSFAIRSPQQGSFYIVVYNTSANAEDVFEFYQRELDRDPWQVEGARASDEARAVRFARPDNADVQGEVDVHHSTLDNRTSIYVYYQDLSRGAFREAPEKEFVLGKSRSLPPGFPNDIPIYGGNSSTVIETIFERGPGATNYLVSFLTNDSQNDVVRFYESEFERRGWRVTDADVRGFMMGIDFMDGPAGDLQGTVYADLFEDDKNYTRVDLLVQVSTQRRN
jgi:hypothetical protein